MKIILTILLLSAIALLFFLKKGDTKTAPPLNTTANTNQHTDSLYDMGTFEIGRYIIDTQQKQILRRQHTAGTDYDMLGRAVRDWHGYKIVPDSSISYLTTTLVLAGNVALFKEHFSEYDSFDFSTFNVIYSEIEHPFTVIAKDKNYLYFFLNGYLTPTKFALQDYKAINDFVYRKGRKLFYVDIANYTLREVNNPPKLDDATLKHVAYSYFTDKNGLYRFGTFTDVQNDGRAYNDTGWAMLEKNVGGKTDVKVYDTYFVYDKAAYSLARSSELLKLHLNVDSIKVGGGYITDGTKTFLRSGSGYRDIDVSQQVMSDAQLIAQIAIPNKSEKEYYMPSDERRRDLSGASYALFYSPSNGFVAVSSGSDRSMLNFDKVWIRNSATHKDEELDIANYRFVSHYFYVYKGKLYSKYNGLVIHADVTIDLEKLSLLTKVGIATEFLFDGNYLIGTNPKRENRGTENEKQLYLKNSILVEQPDALKVLTDKLLTDGDNLYVANDGDVQRIPISQLDFKVIVAAD